MRSPVRFLPRALALAALLTTASTPTIAESVQNLAGMDFSNRKMDGRDLAGANLRGANLRGASLRGANLSGADLRGANLTGADLAGADLRGTMFAARADRANLSRANLEGVDFQNSSLSQTVLVGANMKRTRGFGDITKADFDGADLGGADLSTAFISACANGQFRTVAADQATRFPAWLATGGSLRCAPQPIASPVTTAASDTTPPPRTTQPGPRRPKNALRVGSGRNLRGATLAGRKLHREDFRAADLEGADLSRAMLIGADFQYANLRSANLRGAFFNDADLTGADLRGADVERARFVNAKLHYADLSDLVLHLAGSSLFLPDPRIASYPVNSANLVDRNNGTLSFFTATLHNVRIVGDVTGVDFRRADLRGADLTQAENLDEAALQGVIYDSRTRWSIDPIRHGCVRGEELPITTDFFVGGWTIEAEKPGDIDLIEVFKDKQLTRATEAGVASERWERVVLDDSGEVAILFEDKSGRWHLRRIREGGEEFVALVSLDGKRIRKARRKEL